MLDQNSSDVIQRTAIRSDWHNLAPFSSLFGMGPDDFAGKITNRVPHDMPAIDDFAKYVAMSLASHFFSPVIVLSLILALLFSLKGRGTTRNDVERIVICTAAFVLSWVVLIAASHSFDVGRYGMGLVPFTLLWFAIAIVYLSHVVFMRVPEYYRDRMKSARAAFRPTSEPRLD
jgi:hypothetical protein